MDFEGVSSLVVLEQLDVHSRRWLPVGFFVMLALATACGDEFEEAAPAPPCYEDPWVCPTGQTCWINEDATTFDCFNSGGGQYGDSCINYGAQPTCADGLGCHQLLGQDSGTCMPYCSNTDVARACPNGELCAPARLSSGIEIRICRP